MEIVFVRALVMSSMVMLSTSGRQYRNKPKICSESVDPLIPI